MIIKQCNHENVSVSKLINSILDNNRINVMSIDYNFTELNYINSQNEEIRKISTSIFSKQMKIISILKFSMILLINSLKKNNNQEIQINLSIVYGIGPKVQDLKILKRKLLKN